MENAHKTRRNRHDVQRKPTNNDVNQCFIFSSIVRVCARLMPTVYEISGMRSRGVHSFLNGKSSRCELITFVL